MTDAYAKLGASKSGLSGASSKKTQPAGQFLS